MAGRLVLFGGSLSLSLSLSLSRSAGNRSYNQVKHQMSKLLTMWQFTNSQCKAIHSAINGYKTQDITKRERERKREREKEKEKEKEKERESTKNPVSQESARREKRHQQRGKP